MQTLLFTSLWSLQCAAWAWLGVFYHRDDNAGLLTAGAVALVITALLGRWIQPRRAGRSQRNPDRYRLAMPPALR